MNRADFQRLAEVRIREAEILLNSGYYAGAYYLAGYAVECALKACIAKQVKQYDFPDKEAVNKSYTHNLSELVNIAQLKDSLDNELKSNRDFKINWNSVKSWSEKARYDTNILETKARDFFSATTDTSNGVLEWLKKYW